MLSTVLANTFKEINLLVLRVMVKQTKTDPTDSVFYDVLAVLVNFVAYSLGRVIVHFYTFSERITIRKREIFL